MRSFDWSRTALGPVDSWPQSLRTAVSICLNSRFPMILWWGPDLTVLYNDGYIPILGKKHPQRALGLAGREVWREVWPVVEPLLMRVMNEGKANWADDLQLFINRSGYPEECYFRFSYSPISDETGGIGGVFTPVSDTTQRVVAERRLRSLRELAERSSQAQSVESAYASIAEALSENPYDLPFVAIYQVTADRTAAHLAATAGIAAGSSASPETIQLTADNHSAIANAARQGKVQTLTDLSDWGELPLGPWGDPPSAVVIRPVMNPGQSDAESLFIAGVSARKHLDADYLGFLELVAKQIGTAVAAARAYEEEKRRSAALAELDRAKTTFFSNVSHEFRTPLTLMLGPLEDVLSSRDALPSELSEHILVAHRNGLRLQKLVNTLLDFSRIEAGRMQGSYEQTDLAKLTSDVASTFRSAMEKAGLRFTIECARMTQPVWVDREMWEKVVLNLLSNAFKYTFKGSVAVSMHERAGHAVLSVLDTGIGIAEKDLPHLFERFHRVEGAHGRTQEGTGIGLAMVAELVKMHGGTVNVESALGSGSTFIVSVPFGRAHLPAERLNNAVSLPPTEVNRESYLEELSRWLPSEQRPPAATAASQQAESGGRVLLADDNADMRDYVSRLLRSKYQVESVPNGEDALARALADPPDLVLADVMMPGLDGFELLKALRTHASTKNVPVVLLSARAGEDSRSEGMDAGADDYLVKPFSARELTARVGAHLRLSRLRKGAEKREIELRAEAEAARDSALSVLESITDGFFTLDKNWCFTYVNPTGEILLGAKQEELLGKNHWDLYPTMKGTLGEREYRRAVREGVAVEFETFYVPWQKWFGVKAYPTEAGGISVYFRDITNRKKDEEALRETEERFRQLADNISQFAWMADAQGSVFWFNQRWYDYTGTTFEEVAGWNWRKIHHPDHVERVVERMKRSFETGQIWEDTFPLRGKRGEWRWFLSRARPIRDENSRIVRWFGTNTDINEQLETERELRRANQDLEQFAFSASHDLQEPLRNVALYSELLQKRYGPKLDAQAEQFLGYVMEGAHRMSSLVSDLLAYVQAAVLDHEPLIPVNAETVFEQVVASLGGAIRKNHARITRDPLPQVAMKDVHLQQLLQNLLGNALKYRKDEERPCVHVSAQLKENFWEFAVQDNGIGIAPQFHDKVFGIFKRLHGKNGKYPGTGIGLAICQRIVERYGGRIWLESQAGEGATFRFTVPAVTGVFHA
jgi:PAS domain S-box-containing protein